MNIITSYPCEITSPGPWMPASSADLWNLPTNVPAIHVKCNDAVLLGFGRWIINSATAVRRDVFIYGKNISRCHIEGFRVFGPGWRAPILLETTDPWTYGQHTIINNPQLSGNQHGLRVEGRDNWIAHNGVSDVGGALWYPTVYGYGIEAVGPRARILNNIVRNVRGMGPAAEAVGISTNATDGTIIRGNMVENDTRSDLSMGVWTGYGTDAKIVDNTFRNFKRCVWGTTTAGVADGNRDFDCGGLPGDADGGVHPLYDMPSPQWTGGDI